MGTDHTELWTDLPAEGATRFEPLFERFSKTQAGQVTWRNLGSDAIAQAIAAGERPDLLLVSERLARSLPAGALRPWTSQVAPRVLDGLVAGFRPDQSERMMPVAVRVSAMLGNDQLCTRGMGGFPTSIGQVLREGAEFRSKTGKPPLLPALAEGEHLLHLLTAQGTRLSNARGELDVDWRQTGQNLGVWAGMLRNGIVPRESLALTEAAALSRFLAGEAGTVFVSPETVALVDQQPLPSFGLGIVRYVSGARDGTPVETWGLFRTGNGRLSPAGQNLAAFLVGDEPQWLMAETLQAMPAAKQAIREYKGTFKLPGEVGQHLWKMGFDFGQAAAPVLPLEPRRDALARALRQALFEMVDGAEPHAAMERAAAAFGAEGQS